MVQFWGTTKRSHNETVDAYYNRFKELYDEIQDADGIFLLGIPFIISSSLLVQNLNQFKTIIALIICHPNGIPKIGQPF
jgi:hypothetical protein